MIENITPDAGRIIPSKGQSGKIESHFGVSVKKHIARVLRQDSWYQFMEGAINARAEASQDNATPVKIFAGKTEQIT